MSDDDEDQDSLEEIEAEANASFDSSDLDDPEVRAEINQMMQVVDSLNGNAYREFHVFCNGEMFRIGRIRINDMKSFLDEWVHKKIKARDDGLFTKHIYVFRGGQLWFTMRNPVALESKIEGVPYLNISYELVRTIGGNPEHSVVECDERVEFMFVTGTGEVK